MKNLLILLGGLPGSGKTTLAKAIRHHLNIVYATDQVVITAADDYMVDDRGRYAFDRTRLAETHKMCHRRVKEAMAFETPVIIVHNTFTQLWEREKFYEIAKENDYQVHDLVALNTHGGGSSHGVPAEHLKRMAKRFELPLLPEEKVDHTTKPLSEIVEMLREVPQGSRWHPEGDVYNHTVIVVGRAASAHESRLMQLTALFHDLGKIDATRYDPERRRVTAYGHEKASLAYVHAHADAIRTLGVDVDDLLWLVENHMRIKFMESLGAVARQELEAHPLFPVLEDFNHYDVGMTVPAEEFENYEWELNNLVKTLQLETVHESVKQD